VQQSLESQARRSAETDRALSLRSHAHIRQALSRSPDNLRIRTRPDGLHDVEVVSGFQHMSIRVRRPDGTYGGHCTHDSEEVIDMFAKGRR
jgi:hypothetical protein